MRTLIVLGIGLIIAGGVILRPSVNEPGARCMCMTANGPCCPPQPVLVLHDLGLALGVGGAGVVLLVLAIFGRARRE